MGNGAGRGAIESLSVALHDILQGREDATNLVEEPLSVQIFTVYLTQDNFL